jgi:hypothetical protein
MNDRERALTDYKKTQAERERFKLDVEKREFLPRTEVNDVMTTFFSIINRELHKAFEHELPPRLEGVSALEIKKLCRRKLDEVLRSFPLLFKNEEGKM